jgi:predicted Zn-dependent protease
MNRRRRQAALLAAVAVMLASASPRAEDNKNKKGGGSLLDYFDPRTPDRDAAKRYAPVPLDEMAKGRATGHGHALRLRVYADDDFRGATMRWQKRVEAQIERVNRVVEPTFNVRFEIESLRKWPRSHVGVPFDPLIAELEAFDPGQDVDWVLGLVTSFRGVATSIHQIGGAALISKHLVMRGMDDQEEGRAFAEAFKMLPASERENLYEARKAHKEVVIFLHEWAHTLGALHAEDPEYVMNPRYDAKQSEFTDFERRLLLLALDRRLGERGKAYPEAAELLKLMKDAPESEGSSAERAALEHVLEARAKGVVPPAAPRDGVALGTDDVATYNRAVAAVNAGHADEAWRTAAPVFARHARDGRVLGLACSLCAGHDGAAEARATCDAAIKLLTKDPQPLLDAGACLARAKEPLEAAPYVFAAGKLVEGGAQWDDATLVRLARVAGSVGALTVADAAFARISKRDAAPKELADDLESSHKRGALPRDAARLGVAPEAEPAYLDAYWTLSRDAGDAPNAAVRERVAAFAAKYPDAPAPKVVACMRELRAGHVAAAAKQCQAAVMAYPETVRAHVLLGVIAAGTGRYPDAERSFRRALLLDPGDPSVWHELARFYRTTHATQKLSQLAQEHETLLGAPLPP